MEIGSLVWDKALNRMGVVQGILGRRVRILWNDGSVFWTWERNVELVCK